MSLNSITKYTHFVDILNNVACAYGPDKNQRRYLISLNGDFKAAYNKDKKFRTNEVLKAVQQNLDEIQSSEMPLENRIKLLEKLNQGVQSYAERITNWTRSRWWFCIFKCFGFAACPQKIFDLKQTVEKALKSQQALYTTSEETRIEAKKEGQRKVELLTRVIKQMQDIRNKSMEIAAKVIQKWRAFTAGSIANKRIKKQENERIEKEKLKVEKQKQKELQHQQELQKKREKLETRWKAALTIPPQNIPVPVKDETEVLQKSAWNRIKSTTPLALHLCTFLSVQDLAVLSGVAKREKELAQAALHNLTKKAQECGLTEEEIAIGKAAGDNCLFQMIEKAQEPVDEMQILKRKLNSLSISEFEIFKCKTVQDFRKTYLKYWGATEAEIQQDKAEDSEIAFNTLLLRKWGYSQDEIATAAGNVHGMKNLIKQTEEAERVVKFCRHLPSGNDLLNRIIKGNYPELLQKTPLLRFRIAHFNFLETHKLRAERDDDEDIVSGCLPIIGGNTLLKVADEIRKYMRSEEAQEIKQLTIQWSASGYWPISTASQLETLPLSINLLKGLHHLEILDHDVRACKKLPPLALPKLQTLIVRATDITELPYMNLPEVTMCELSNNRITEVPNFVGNVPKLTTLSLRCSQSQGYIKRWDPDTRLPPNLTKLYIGDSKLRKLPNTIGRLKHLTKLEIIQSGSEYRTFGPRTDYQEAYLKAQENHYRHDIASIPPEIVLLENLKVLIMNNCALSERTPGLEWLALIPKLEKLDVNCNNFKSAPNFLKEFNNKLNVEMYLT